MILGPVDFPIELIEAQRNGTLVVFAGAGVSIDAPSNYPSFEGLAQGIGGEVFARDENEAIDRYLGRLAEHGVKVHEQVRGKLSRPESKPNELHRTIVQLFRSADAVRLVTTNFDAHFDATAAEFYMQASPEIFCAPALPRGNDFSGIVYVHGSINRAPQKMVLTDRDFGRAYIVEGWATEFLKNLFARFTVLFVGYSHNDVMLNYLARGLTADGAVRRRFALTHELDGSRWRNLGIVHVQYPLADPALGKHRELREGLKAWADQIQSGALNAERRIRGLVESDIFVLSREDEDYLKHAVTELPTLRFFTRHAKSFECLEWIGTQDVFRRLFVNPISDTQIDIALATWFASNYALIKADEAIAFLRKHRLSPGRLLWHELAWTLNHDKATGKSLSNWIALLLANLPPQPKNDDLELILLNCQFPNDGEVALLLWNYFTTPRMEFDPSVVGTGVDVPVSEYALAKAHNEIFRPKLQYFGPRLAPIVTKNLETAHRIFICSKEPGRSLDPLSLWRGKIESKDQDNFHLGISVVIDVAVTVLEWALSSDSEFADALVAQWTRSDSLLLNRLAVFGMARATHIDPDSKLEWLLKRDLLYRIWAKHEIFLLLESAFPHAGVAMQQRLIERLLRGGSDQIGDARVREYEIFNAIVWVARVAPRSSIATSTLERLKSEHPDFGEREHPDLDFSFRSTEGFLGPAPVATEDFSSFNLMEVLARLDGVSQEAERKSVEDTAIKSPAWGLRIAGEAILGEVWKFDLWQPVIRGFRSGEPSREEWGTMIRLLRDSPPVRSVATEEIISMLETVTKGSEPIFSDAIADETSTLVEHLWALCLEDRAEESDGLIDWLGRAMNHRAGRLAMVSMHVISNLRKESALSPEVLGRFQTLFSTAISGNLYSDQLVCVVLAAQVHFLFSLDKDWTARHVVKLLDLDVTPERAERCWYGYLYWGRWSNELLPALAGMYEQRLKGVDLLPTNLVRRFCADIAGISAYAIDHQFAGSLLKAFHRKANLEVRVVWARELHSIISAMDDGARVNMWNRWLRAYWENRLNGVPIVLDGQETGVMFDWVLSLGAIAREAAELFCRGPQPQLAPYRSAYKKLFEGTLLRSNPESVAKMLEFLAQNADSLSQSDLIDFHRSIEVLVSLIPDYPKLRTLASSYARLGGFDSQGLIGLLR